MDKYLNAFLSRKGNKITFDDKGKVVYFNEERQKSAIKKRYPPSAMQYSFDEVPDL